MPLYRVLDEDLELLEVVPVGDRPAARAEAVAEVVDLWRRWAGPQLIARHPKDGLGLPLLGGLLLRRVDLVGQPSNELLGPGDLIPLIGRVPNGAYCSPSVTWRALDDA